MKIPPFDSLVWGSLRLAPIIAHENRIFTYQRSTQTAVVQVWL